MASMSRCKLAAGEDDDVEEEDDAELECVLVSREDCKDEVG